MWNREAGDPDDVQRCIREQNVRILGRKCLEQAMADTHAALDAATSLADVLAIDHLEYLSTTSEAHDLYDAMRGRGVSMRDVALGEAGASGPSAAECACVEDAVSESGLREFTVAAVAVGSNPFMSVNDVMVVMSTPTSIRLTGR